MWSKSPLYSGISVRPTARSGSFAARATAGKRLAAARNAEATIEAVLVFILGGLSGIELVELVGRLDALLQVIAKLHRPFHQHRLGVALLVGIADVHGADGLAGNIAQRQVDAETL